ncbi:unnamed protein product [Laminaria digitata]
MKGLAGSAGAVAVIALGLVPGVGATGTTSLRQEPSDSHGPTTPVGIDTAAGSPSSTDALNGNGSTSRRLQSDARRNQVVNDDALDANGTPAERAANALNQRFDWAETEFAASQDTLHLNNGDRSSAATFHKSLPHDSLGQVDSKAFDALTECVTEGDFALCEQVPAGDEDGLLVNPLGGIAVDMAGPASHALTIPPASALNSEDLAAQMGELYWMALTRDVPFSQYGEDEATVAAADNLATMPGFAKMNGVATGADGRADPHSQLFRTSALGVEKGPMISQLLVKDFTLDSITATPMQTTFAPGVDYMADYDEWLFIQNGGKPDSKEEEDDVKRYIRNARDLSRLVVTDTINTEAYRAALILLEEGAISRSGFNGPYAQSSRQTGFVNFGVSHVMRLVGTAELTQRSAWYQKWNVHMFARPEAIAGTIHNVIYGNLDVDFDDSILNNRDLLRRVAERNGEITGNTGRRDRTYLLSQAVKEGSPTHPSYPAGHATQNGAFATILKALVGLERGASCFSNPEFPDDEGLTLLPYTGDDCLTYEGEINKMAVNVAFGRNMCGVHWRIDSQQGLLLGEMAGVRILQQEAVAFPENEAYEFRLMSGQTIRLETDGSFFIDDKKCSGDAYMGADQC